MSELLQKPLNKLTHEERLQLIEAIYMMWVIEDSYSDNFILLSNLLRGVAHTPLSKWPEWKSEKELFDILLDGTNEQPDDRPVKEYLDREFENAYCLERFLPCPSSESTKSPTGGI